MISKRFNEFRQLVDTHGPTVVGEKIGYGKSAVSRVYHGKYDADPNKIINATLVAFEIEKNIEIIPEGYMKDAQGRLVPVDLIGDINLRRDAVVRKIMQLAVVSAAKLQKLRGSILAEIEEFCKTSAEMYDKDLGGIKGNVQLTSFDGQYRIKRSVDDLLEFDERLQVAKELIDQCLKDWTKDSRSEIRAIIDDAFQVDKTGRVNTKRILSLRRLDIKDERWRKAMEAISDSVSVAESKTYLRFYERGDSGKYRQIAIGI